MLRLHEAVKAWRGCDRDARGRPSPLEGDPDAKASTRLDIEREINGLSVEKRLAAPQKRSAALVVALEAWMRASAPKLSRHASIAKLIDDMLTRWGAFTHSQGRRPHYHGRCQRVTA